MTGYRRMGRDRKRHLAAYRLHFEPDLMIRRAAFLKARRERRAAEKDNRGHKGGGS